MCHALIHVACADPRHVLEHDAERVERAVISPNRLMRQPVRRSRLVNSRLRSHPDRLGPGHPRTRAEVGTNARHQVPSRWSKACPLWRRPRKSMSATPAGCMPAVVRNAGEREYAEERGLAAAWDGLPRAPRVNLR